MTIGPVILDLLLLFFIISTLWNGWMKGGCVALGGLIGAIGGGYAATAVLPTLISSLFTGDEIVSDNSAERLVTVFLPLSIGIILGYFLGNALGRAIRRLLPSFVRTLDSLLGAFVHVMTGLLIVFVILVPLTVNSQSAFSQAVRDSRILAQVDHYAPAWVHQIPNRASVWISANGFPTIVDPFDRLPIKEVAPPDDELHNSSVIQQTYPSVVRIVGEARQCRRMHQGSGFVVAPGYVMTNAHVVAGTDTVRVEAEEGTRDARVVHYDANEDIAILSVPEIEAPVIPWAAVPGMSGDDALVLGYPQGGPFKATPVRIRNVLDINGPNIYSDQRVQRQTYTLRGSIVQGNSGGPLINMRGETLGLIFGSAVDDSETGYALTRDEVLKSVGEAESYATQYSEPADTGACVIK